MPGEGAGAPFGQYVLLRRLARGGMAEVFLAQQHGLEGFDRRVAVKRILPHLVDAPHFIKMFLGEAKLAAQLTHPNIVHIYDFGKVEADYFIAMEYVDGVHAGDLFTHGDDRDRLSPTMIARIGADAATALHYAHELRTPTGQRVGLVHRDVSPANLMISFDGVVKLCDFGIAKAAAISDQLTNPGTVKGKYGYMSPEQTTGIPLDGRSDVYSLAIVLWELLAGKTIVPRGDAVDAMRRIRDGKLTPIAEAAPWTPEPLARAITWALETRRERRPTAMQLAQALEAFIKSSPELATPMQVGVWLRNRFPPDPTGETDTVPEGTEAVLAMLATPPMSLARGLDPRIVATPPPDTTDETFPLPRASRPVIADPSVPPTPSLADAATMIAPPPADLLARSMELEDPPAAVATTLIVEPRPAASAAVHPAPPQATTLIAPPGAAPQAATLIALPPGQFPSALPPTVYDPAHAIHASPMAGAQVMPGADGSTAWQAPPRSRRTLAIGGLVGVVFLMVVIAVATRGPSHPQLIKPSVVAAPADAPPPRPIDAAPIPIDAAPVEIDAMPVEIDAAPIAPPDAAPAATIEIRTNPDGATIKIAGASHRSPAELVLPPGRYFVDAELDGWMPERRAVELGDAAHVVQEIEFTMRLRGRDVQTGHLIARTTPPSEVFLGTRRMAETPVSIDIDPGTYVLVFKHPRHANVVRRVTITAGKTTKVQIALP